MDPNPPRSRRTESLILPPRRLQAALRKSAERAQRLADAFGQTVPTVASDSQKAIVKAPKKTLTQTASFSSNEEP